MFSMIYLTFIVLYFVQCYTQNTKSPVSKTNLRNIDHIRANEIKNELIDETVNKIYNQIVSSAGQKQNTYEFTIYCTPNHHHNIDELKICSCKNYVNEEHNELINQLNGNNIASIEVHYQVLQDIRTLFPDCEIKEYYKNCCTHYSITW
jgi:hypothetical protein